MQVPVEWHVYIIPGFMYVTCLFFLCPAALRQELKGWLVDKPIGLVAIILASYLLGVASNHFLVRVGAPIAVWLGLLPPSLPQPKPTDEVFLYQNANILAQAFKNAYLSMLFSRSVFFALIPLGVLCLWHILRVTFKERTSAWRVIFNCLVTVLVIALPVIFRLQWMESKGTFQKLYDRASEFVSSANTSKQPGSTNQ
jgi:hypothetical protein